MDKLAYSICVNRGVVKIATGDSPLTVAPSAHFFASVSVESA